MLSSKGSSSTYTRTPTTELHKKHAFSYSPTFNNYEILSKKDMSFQCAHLAHEAARNSNSSTNAPLVFYYYYLFFPFTVTI